MIAMKHLLVGLFVLLPAAPASAQSPSAGCGAEPPAEVPASVEIDGVERQFITIVPKHYQRDLPHDLVFGFHGRTDNNAKVRSYFRLESAATQPTIFVYPAAIRDAKGRNHWWRRHDQADALRDYQLFDQILASIEASYCIDRDQVYLIGHSLGATFVNSLGCARADKVRAIATVAGGIRRAKCAAPLAALILHNPKDKLVKIADGEHARDWLLKNNGFDDHSVATDPEDLNCRRYGPEGDPNPVIWCAHHQDLNGHKRFYPHNWPRETATVAFEFFSRLPPAAGSE